MKKTLGELVADFRAHKGWNSRELAEAVTKAGSACSRQNIESLEGSNYVNVKYIDGLAKVMGTTVDVLRSGNYVVPYTTGNDFQINETRINKDETLSDRLGDEHKTIPTDMAFTTQNLADAIVLLGGLLGALDKRSRQTIGMLLGQLADSPDEALDIAAKSAALATVQKRLVNDERLNEALIRSKSAKADV